MEQITKIDAAKRQLSGAVKLFFSGFDPIVVHALAVSAANVFADLADSQSSIESWREKIRLDHGMSEASIRRILHGSWNFFKHADRDPNSILDFNPEENEYLIFFAVLECGEIIETTTEMQVFQLWFLALGVFELENDNEIQRCAKSIFPKLVDMSKAEQLSAGKAILALQIEADEIDD